MNKNRVLVIRFSSFGDIVQATGVLPLLKHFLEAEIHWVVRSDFQELLSLNPFIDKVWSFDRQSGVTGLLRLAYKLKSQGFTHIYDAHCNLRSKFLTGLLCPPWSGINFTRREKSRIARMELFNLGLNSFPKPYKGMHSYLWPLSKWEIPQNDIPHQGWHFSKEILLKLHNYQNKIILVPSAAWEMKRWPLEYWKKLIQLLPELEFVVLGGPGDVFCQELAAIDPKRVQNLAGKLSLVESCFVIASAYKVVSADTGLLHVADLLDVPAIALIGPTAFGHPSGKQVKTLEVELGCRPCSKDGSGKCSQAVYQKCMVEITPEWVARELF